MTREHKGLSRAEYDALPEVLTPDQAGLIFGVRGAQVLRWANDGTLPGRKIGGRWRFSKTRLEQHAAGRHSEPTGGASP